VIGRIVRALSFRRRQLAARLLILRKVGFRHAWRRQRLKARHARTEEQNAQATEGMWRAAAAEVGADVRRLSPALLEFRLGDATARVAHQMTTPFADRVSYEIADDKPCAYRLLAEAGLPVPEHLALDAGDHDSARAFFERVPPPLLVKPARGGGGSGVVGHIRTFRQLRRALTDVGRYREMVLVERQSEGDSYRLLFLEGALLDVLRRSRPHVVGDGTSTIAELMFGEFERRIAAGGAPAGFPSFEVDLDCLFTLEHGGHRLDTVLPGGEPAVVKTATNFSSPEQTRTERGAVCDEVVASARRAADVLGIRLAGVDVVTTDPGRPLGETVGVILEVNSIPGLTQHSNVADAAGATQVAVPVLAALLGASAGGAEAGAQRMRSASSRGSKPIAARAASRSQNRHLLAETP
jgi:cyanophycin synthetase